MYVTDTHGLVYHSRGKTSQLGIKARRLFQKADSGNSLIYIPTIALWEIAVLVARRYLDLPYHFDHWCRSIENSAGFAIMPLDWLDVEEARKLPFADPYDCLIAGTAIRLNMPLITRDHVIVDSKLVETVW
jgi:PIN domain nuclease of toxin-antitoxin system